MISKDDRHAYLTNSGDGTLSSYTIAPDGTLTLLQSVAGVTTPGQRSVRDEGLTKDGRYLYAIDIVSRQVHGWAVNHDGSLTAIGAFPGLPSTVAGIATA